eukprot:15478526-Alexandrium_andersonii.AAC.1
MCSVPIFGPERWSRIPICGPDLWSRSLVPIFGPGRRYPGLSNAIRNPIPGTRLQRQCPHRARISAAERS